jgi:hypothetical protein
MAARTAKFSLPFVTLPWALCRASTHGKDVAVCFLPFAVRAPRTTKTLFSVVFYFDGFAMLQSDSEFFKSRSLKINCNYISDSTSRSIPLSLPIAIFLKKSLAFLEGFAMS